MLSLLVPLRNISSDYLIIPIRVNVYFIITLPNELRTNHLISAHVSVDYSTLGVERSRAGLKKTYEPGAASSIVCSFPSVWWCPPSSPVVQRQVFRHDSL